MNRRSRQETAVTWFSLGVLAGVLVTLGSCSHVERVAPPAHQHRVYTEVVR